MMIFEALFGFIGIGVQPPTPTFGNIIADGAKYIVNYWWISTMPGFSGWWRCSRSISWGRHWNGHATKSWRATDING